MISFKRRFETAARGGRIPVALAQLLPAHLLRDEIAVGIFLDQSALLFETIVEWRCGNRLQHADHRQCDSVFLDEPELVLKDLFVIAVEADDEPAVDVEAIPVTPMMS